jgi:metal-responsive CopG/Arc/MetJ family transcriptional regulator
MDVETLHKYTKGKTKIITFKINPKLLSLLDKTIKQEKDIYSRSELIERCILKFLMERGKL